MYTEDLFVGSRLKNRVKRLLGRVRGPAQVFHSLIQGFNELKVFYNINDRTPPSGITACVLSGSKTLTWAIAKKQAGVINKIIAGPNIVINPLDFGGVLTHSAVDKIIVPSEWVKDFYIKAVPGLTGKIEIWAAGVDVPGEINMKKEIDFIVFNKIGRRELFTQIVGLLQTQKFKFKIIKYGQFHQREYFQMLADAKSLIYLSASESQGLALFEAWARNVPTLVWEAGTFEREGIKVSGKISAPYLSSQAGLSFKNFSDFQQCLPAFISAAFTPRQYVMENFNHKISARKYLDLIENR